MLNPVIQTCIGVPSRANCVADPITTSGDIWFRSADGSLAAIATALTRILAYGGSFVQTYFDGAQYGLREIFRVGDANYSSEKRARADEVLCQNVITFPAATAMFDAADTNAMVELLVQFWGVRDLSPNFLCTPLFYNVNVTRAAADQAADCATNFARMINAHPLMKRFLTATAVGPALTVVAKVVPYEIGQWWDYSLTNFHVAVTKQSKLLAKQTVVDAVYRAPKMGYCNWQQVADVERRALGYRGITNYSVVPITMPRWQTENGRAYSISYDIMGQNRYQAADGIERTTNECYSFFMYQGGAAVTDAAAAYAWMVAALALF